MSLRSKLGFGAKAGSTEFTPRSNIPRSDVQGAVEYVMDNAENVGTVYAPTDAQYLTSASSSGLSNERVVGDSTTITWDFTGIGTATAALQHLGLEDLADPGGDRIAFWDDSEGAFKWLDAGQGLDFTGTNIHVTDELLDLINLEFVSGDVLYHDGTNLKRLAAGTDGQFLRTRGAGTAPDWQNISGGGDMLRANNLSDLASASTARTNLGVAIGTNVQAYDAGLQSISGLTTAADKMIYTTALDTYAVADLTAFARTLLDDANQAAMRTTLGLTPGTDVQAYDADLTTWAGLTPSANAQSLVTAANYAAMRALLDLEVGTDFLSPAAIAAAYQPLDGELTAIAGLTSAVDKVPYFTGSGTAGVADFTSFGRSLVDDADASTARTTLGLVIGTNVQAYSSVLQNTTASFLTAQETKINHITVTQAVDLDAIETRVNDLDAAVVLKGGWDASAGTFPGGGAAQAGWSYIVTVAGTVDSVAFSINDRVLAYLDNASTTTYASNWLKLDYTDQVLSVAGRTGAVTIASADITDSTANGRGILTAADYSAMRTLLSLVPGTNVQAYDAELAAFAGLTSAADKLGYFTGSGTMSTTDFTSVARTLVNQTTQALMRTTGLGLSSNGSSLVSAADYAAMKALLDLEIGIDVQAYSANLSATGTTTIKLVGAETIWVPAKSMTARTTNGAASGTTESTTNDVVYPTFDFDQSTEEGVGFWIAMPKSWNESTVTFIPYWTAASGSGGVVFAINAYAFSNDDAIDTAPSGQQTSTDTLIATGDIHVGPESSAITIGGTPAEGDIVYFQITREVGDGSDTLSGDAKLIGVKVIFTTNAATDA